MFRGIQYPSFFDLSQARFAEFLSTTNFHDNCNSVYDSDEFRMYTFKVKKCSKTRTHDWTECPYAHHGEKARRRDPRRYNYAGIACTEFRIGDCKKGELCEFAHGIFEFWLHPSRYRTRFCNSGIFCRRKVCFFAHSVEQLRPEIKYKSKYSCYAAGNVNGSNNGIASIIAESSSTSTTKMRMMQVSQPLELMRNESYNPLSLRENWVFLENLRGLNIEDDEQVGGDFSCDEQELEPDIGWVSELVN